MRIILYQASMKTKRNTDDNEGIVSLHLLLHATKILLRKSKVLNLIFDDFKKLFPHEKPNISLRST